LVVAALASVLSVLAGAAPARAAAAPLLTITFNVCGNVCRQGEVARTAGNVADQVRGRRVAVALLQELCYSQFLGVRSRLARYGYSAVFAAAATGGHCDDHDRRHGRGFGVAIVARGPLTGRVVRRLPSPYGTRPEGRVALGARVRLGGRPVFVVTTHTAPGGPNLALQLAAVRRWLVPVAAGGPVVFGGDLNSLPGNAGLDGFYAAFREAEGRADPRPTFIPVPRRIDYLFGSRGFLTPRGAATACGNLSDHCLFLASFAGR